MQRRSLIAEGEKNANIGAVPPSHLHSGWFDRITGFRHFSSQGHCQEVTAVATDQLMDNIASASSDGTVRIWIFEQDHASAYQLAFIVSFSNDRAVTAATALSFVDASTLAIATCEGDLFFLCLKSRTLCNNHLHKGRIDFLLNVETSEVQSEALGSNPLLITGGEDKKALVLELVELEDNYFRTEHLLTFEHEHPVVAADYIDGPFNDDSVKWATCCYSAVHLWNSTGHPLFHLSTGNPNIKSLTVTHDNRYLLVADGEHVSVWSLTGDRHNSRRVSKSDGSAHVDTSPPPCERYVCPEVEDIEVILVDELEDGGSNQVTDKATNRREWVVDVREETECAIWALQQRTAEQEGDGTPRLVKSDELTIIRSIDHSRAVTAMAVAEDPEDGPVLLTACSDGTVSVWDVNGPDAGELTAQMRSLNIFGELVIPIVLLLITFFQFICFAFGPSAAWPPEVEEKTDVAYDLSSLNMDFRIRIRKAQLFWVKSFVVLGCMIIFNFSALLSVPTKFAKVTGRLQSSPRFIQEVRDYRKHGPMHLIVMAWRYGPVLGLKMFFFVMSTVLVVPVTTACIRVVSCVSDSSGMHMHVQGAPEIVCYEDDHMKLALAFLFVCPLYFVLVFPYAMVQGETDYVQRSELFRPSSWNTNVRRKLSVLHLGPVHTHAGASHVKAFSDVLAKILLPIVENVLNSMPLLQMTVLTLIMAWLMLIACVYKPYVDDFFTALFQGSRAFTFCTVSCGLLTVILNSTPAPDTLGGNGPWRQWAPLILLCLSGCTVFAITAWRCCTAVKIADKTHVVKISSSEARTM